MHQMLSARLKAVFVLTVLSVTAFAKDKPKIIIEVVNSETSERVYTYTTPGKKGKSETSCDTNGTTNGTVSDSGIGPTQINANTNANTNCTTTSTPATPPQTHVSSTTQEHVSAILPDGRHVILWCQNEFRRCDYLQPGKYTAEPDGNVLFVYVHDLSGRAHRVKYRAVRLQEIPATQEEIAANVAQPRPTVAVPVAVQPSGDSESVSTSLQAPRGQAAIDDAETQYRLGMLYETGQGVPQSYEQASLWYRKAAEQNLAAAQYRLGLLYSNGVGVPKDETQAAAWYRKAADQGSTYAQEALGLDYFTGEGVGKDYKEAYFWLYIASTGKVPELVTGDRATHRDAAAFYLEPSDLADTKLRARQWLEDHQSQR